MRYLEYYLSLKILLEIAGLAFSISVGFLNLFIVIFGGCLLIDTAFWMQAKKVIKSWDVQKPKR